MRFVGFWFAIGGGIRRVLMKARRIEAGYITIVQCSELSGGWIRVSV